MSVIDADCHIIEPEETWNYFDESELRYKPLVVIPADANGNAQRLLVIEGRLRGAAPEARAGRAAPGAKEAREEMAGFSRTTEDMRTMRDVEGRLGHMDELGVDVQVLFPTAMVLGQITANAPAEVALCRSYNRWIADVSSKGQGRLPWIATPPLLDIKESIDQMRWSAEHGACGIRMRGFEGDRLLSDPYFFPVYQEAEQLGIAVTVHAGNANPGFNGLVTGNAWASAKVPVVTAFHNILYNEVPAKFPKLRWGFIEAAASWLPYMLIDLERRMVRDGRTALGENPLKENNMYVASQTNDDFDSIIKYAGDDNLVIGSDYGHSDTSSELEALKNFKSITGLSASVTKKILEDNPKELYGL